MEKKSDHRTRLSKIAKTDHRQSQKEDNIQSLIIKENWPIIFPIANFGAGFQQI